MKLETRSKDSYLEKLAGMADSTRQNFKATYESFDRFCQEKYDRSAEDIIQEIPHEKDSEYEILQAWINWLSKNIIPSTINTKFSALRGYFHYRGIKMYKEDIRQEIKLPKIPKEEKYPLKLEEIQKILNEASFKKKTFYLTLLSSGMRVGEAVQLKKKHFDTSEKQFMIKIPANMTKTKAGRTVFISKEASDAVRTLLKKTDDDDLVFAKNNKPHYAVCCEEMTFRRILRNTGLIESYDSSRTNKITMHSFRSYFFTKATRKHGDNYAHKMTGHGGYLMEYDRMTEPEKRTMYLELEPDLIIDSTERQKRIIDQKDKKIAEIEVRFLRLGKMMDKADKIQKQLAKAEVIGAKVLDSIQKEDDDLYKKLTPERDRLVAELVALTQEKSD